MGRIGEAFSRANEENRAALVIYLCAGDPDLATTPALVRAIADAGADVIELGVPFSDPTADGPAIQRASERALAKKTTVRGVLDVVRDVRAAGVTTPILLFGYYNPILSYGEAKLAREAKAAGADGFLVVDLPPEEAAVFRDPIVAEGLDFVPLVAPTSDAGRTKLASDAATSFVYYVSITGVTGGTVGDLEDAAKRGGRVEKEIGKPVALGFGVKTPEDVRAAAAHVSGVVVGSAIVRVIEDAKSASEAVEGVGALVRSLAGATKR